MENSYARSAHGQMLPWLRALATLVFFTAFSWQADAQSCCQVNIPSASVQNGCVVLDSAPSGSCGDQVEWMWAENASGSIQGLTGFSTTQSLEWCPENAGDFRICVRVVGCSQIYESGDTHVNPGDCSGGVTAIKVIDNATGEVAANIPYLSNNDSFSYSDLPADYQFEVLVNGNSESAQITVNGQSNTENVIPYNSYESIVPGNNTISVTLFAQDNLGGAQCDHVTINFHADDDSCVTLTNGSSPYGTNDDCFLNVIENDSYCCNTWWDNVCQDAYEECQTTGNLVETCTLSGYSSETGRIVWLPNFATDLRATSSGVFFAKYDDGTAKLYGSVESIANPNNGFEFSIWFDNQSTFAQWTSQGGLPKNPNLGDESTWTFYSLDANKTSGMVGFGAWNGQHLIVEDQNNGYGLQIGDGANALNANDNGFSMWFDHSGTSIGHGDFNATITCDSDPLPSVDQFELECADGLKVSVQGVGIEGQSCGNLTLGNGPGDLEYAILETVWKGSNPPSSVTFVADGVNYVASAQNVIEGNGSNQNNKKAYRAQVPNASNVSVCVPSGFSHNLRSFVAYEFSSNAGMVSAGSGEFVGRHLWQTSYTMTLPIEASDVPRDIVVTLPLSDMSDDGRNADFDITAGPISKHYVITGNTEGLSLNLTPFILEDVPGDVTEVEIFLQSNPSNNPSSFIAAGLAIADAQCDVPDTEQVCDVIGFNGLGQRHFYFANTFGQDWISDADGLKFVQFADGTAKLSGEIYRIGNANDRFDVVIYFKDKSDFAQWTGMGMEAKLCGGATMADAQDWTYWNFDQDRPSVLTGRGNLTGEYLFVRPMDGNEEFGLQYGSDGANCKNDDFGFSVWFSYGGSSDGHGDINANLNCPLPVCDIECPSDLTVDCESNIDPGSTGYPSALCANDAACQREAGEFDFEMQGWSNGNNGWSLGSGWDVGTGCDPSCGSIPNVFIDFTNFHTNYDTKLKSPMYEACCTDNVYLNFCMQQDLYGGEDVPGYMDIQYRINGGSWNTLHTYQNVYGSTVNYNDTYEIPGASGQHFEVRFRARGEGSSQFTMGGWGIDDIRVYGESSGCSGATPVDLEWTYSDVSNGTCPEIITRTFSGEYAGELFSCTQTITLVDEVAPVFTSVPEDTSVSCSEDLPNDTATAIDNCGDAIITMADLSSSNGCDDVITRTFTATDNCGNTATAVQLITVVADVPVVSASSTPDNCSQGEGNITLTFDDSACRSGIKLSIDGGANFIQVNDNSGSYTFEGLTGGTYDLFAQWGDNDCPTDLEDITVGDNTDIELEINNYGICVVDLYEWLPGGDQFVEELAPGETFTVTTHVGAMWRIVGDNWNPGDFDAQYTVEGCFDQVWNVNPDYCQPECNSDLTVDAGSDQNICEGESVTLTADINGESDCNEITACYTVGNGIAPAGCFSTPGTGVVFQRAAGCAGSHTIWQAGNDLKLTEFADGTATIDGSIINNGQVGILHMDLYEKENTGNTWNASCYTNNLGSNKTFYRSFIGTVTVGNDVFTIEEKISEQHFILADGAGFNPGSYGLGSWTGGTFGGCTEWFATLTPCDIPSQETSIVWSTGETTESITVNAGGTYTVTVTDCAGCVAQDEVNINILENPEVSVTSTNPVCLEENGTITFTFADVASRSNIEFSIDGGNSWPAAYNVADNSGSFTIDGLAPGSYDLFVRWGNDECPVDLEDITLVADECASLGNFVFFDEDRDGIQDAGEEGVENVSVELYICGEADPIASTTTDENGFYIFENLNPDNDYYVVFDGDSLPADYVFSSANQGGDDATDSDADENGETACVELTSGEFNDTVDAGINQPTASLGNFVFFDDDRDGIQDAGEAGVEDVTVQLFVDGGAAPVATTITDENGFYIFENLEPGVEYFVVFAPNSLPTDYVFSPANQGGDDTTDSDAGVNGQSQVVTLAPGEFNDTIDAGINQPTASLGNFVFFDEDRDGIQDAGEEGVEDVSVELYICGEADPIASTTTDENGFYLFENLEPGVEYFVVFDGDSLPADYVFSAANQGGDDATDSDADENGETACVELAPGEFNDTVDAGINQPTASLGNFVFFDDDRDGIQDAGEAGVEDVTVQLFVNGGAAPVATTTTDENGFYIFENLEPGVEYYVVFAPSSLPSDFVFSPANQGGDDTSDSDAGVNGQSQVVTLAPGEFNDTIDAGINNPLGSIGDYVWEDEDQDGVQDPNEDGIENVGVELYICGEADPIASTTTDENGFYIFENLEPGVEYFVVFDAPNGFEGTQANAGGDDTLDSDADENGATNCYELNPGEEYEDFDAGFFIPTNIGDFVWFDDNQNGIQDAGEDGVEGVEVNLVAAGDDGIFGTIDDEVVATQTTDADGNYLFEDVLPGEYIIVFNPETLPTDFVLTAQDQGGDDNEDSDANPLTGATAPFTVTYGQDDDLSFDAGISTCPVPQLDGDEPMDVNITCEENVPAAPSVTFSDFIYGAAEVSFTEVMNDLDCGEEIVRTWTAINECGTEAMVDQVITITDDLAPVITFQTPDQTIECDQEVPEIVVTYEDNCDDNLTVVVDNWINDLDCGYEYVKWCSATDDCGNSSEALVTITVLDTTAPVATNQPEDLTIECDEEVPAFDPEFTDNCDEDLELTAISGIAQLDCGYEINRSWTAIDDCGNETTVSQTITVLDTTAPVFLTTPEDYVVNCDNGSSDPEFAGEPTAEDNCDDNLSITFVDGVAGEDCPASFDRTWTVMDDCGNQTSYVQVITINDFSAPVLSTPADVTVECDESTEPNNTGEATATDDCSMPTITFVDGPLSGDCPYTFDRTWTAVDPCGNTVSDVQTITIVDTVAPVADGEGQELTIECHEEMPQLTMTFTDNCDANLEVTVTTSVEPDGCNDTFFQTITASDECGNQSSVTNIIHVVDTTAPELIGVPADATINCNDEVPSAIVAATDNCDEDVVVVLTAETSYNTCGYEITRTWSATDECGNTVSESQVLTVIDTEAPVITVPADYVVNCDNGSSDPEFAGEATATDNCSEFVITFVDGPATDVCPATFERTWTATDACGNASSDVQIITINDFAAPVITCAADVTIECTESTDPSNTGEATATDDCSVPTISYTDGDIMGDCPYTFERTWIAVDPCGNEATCVQTITIVDTVAPVLSGEDDEMTLECHVSPNIVAPTATDNCDTDVMITPDVQSIDGACAQERTDIYTWTAMDECGNTSTRTLTINFVDTTAPELIGVPADATINCNDEVPSAIVAATDNCDEDVVVVLTAETSYNTCGYEITRTWSATDECGNTVSESQVLTVIDTEAPVITVPADYVVNCDNGSSDPEFAGEATATDNCSEFVITFVDGPATDVCPATFERTWTATDACGNASSDVQVITINDFAAPVITCAADVTIECTESTDPSNTGEATATDDCSVPTISYTDGDIMGDCPYTFERTWIAVDPCGNEATCVQTITIVDTVAPVLSGEDDEMTLECHVSPNIVAPTATDNCDTDVMITPDVQSIDGACAQERTNIYTWTAMDECGNTSIRTLTINFVDTTAPELIGVPADATINCNDEVPAAIVAATDNCDNNPVVSMSAETIFGDCGYEIIRTWTATDACGNASSDSQTLTVIDTEAPVITVPADYVVNCDNGSSDPEFAGEATATDNCSEFVITFVDGPATDVCPATFERTWTATDACGNASSDVQLITINDASAPFISCPENITVECTESTDPSNTGEATATDDCSVPTITYVDGPMSGDCPYTFNRTWTAVDPCGNQSTCIQTITIVDTVAPVLSGEDDELTLECNVQPSIIAPTATDNCDEDVSISVNVENVPGDCANESTDTYTWTAMDECGNTATRTLTINFVDTTAPELIGVPADATIDCDDDVPSAIVFATDNCDNNPVVSMSAETVYSDCGYEIIRTWTAVDACGNTTSDSQTLNVIDITAPVVTAPADYIVNCDNGSSEPEFAGEATATDNCSEFVITFVDGPATDVCPATFERTWTATDACGNASSDVQIITINDGAAPSIVCPADITIECTDSTDPSNTGEATATDDCSVPMISYVDGDITGDCPYTFERTWTAVDPCGNEATCVQTITIEDTVAPVLSGEDEVLTLECNVLPNIIAPTATDNCDEDVTITPGFENIPGDCDNERTEIYTWTAMDECGNTSTRTLTINFVDTTAPVFVTDVANATVECDNVPAAPAVFATDNCGDVTPVLVEESEDFGCETIITRTWTATDACGNATTLSQVLTVVDTTAPVIVSQPANVTIECDQPEPTVAPVFSDNCDDDLTITAISGISNVTECGYTIDRSWTATDECGNSTSASQTITVVDTTAPVLEEAPADMTVNCTDVPAPAALSATDNCDDAPVVVLEESFGTGCPYTITRTWTATDACGNSSEEVQVLTVIDEVAPVLVGVPADITEECGDAGSPAVVTATDNCDIDVPVTFSQEVIGQVCPLTIVRTWTAVDNCGNTTSASQTIVIDDETAPVFVNGPASEITVECDNVPAPAMGTAFNITDNCDANPTLSFEEEQVDGEVLVPGQTACGYTLIRTWTATDLCGNEATYVQTVNVVDTTAPVLFGVPADITVECTAIPAAPQVSAADNCFDGEIEVTLTESTNPLDCGYELIRTWSAMDNCLNEVSATQTITVSDVTAPVLVSVPADETVECDEELPAGMAEFTDNCDDDLNVTVSLETVEQNCGYYVIRTFTATDDCGNATSATQTINFVDTTAPVLEGVPADASVECSDIPVAASPSASDNCDDAPVITFAEEIISGECPYTIERTWTATDVCGNASSMTQVLTVIDTTAPVLLNVPADATVECDNIPGVDAVEASDNCDTDLTVMFNDEFESADCGYIITRTWTVMDDCGNEASASQVLTVIDTTAPTASNVPAGFTIECDQDVPFAAPSFEDNCDDQVQVEFNETIVDGDCPNNYEIVRTWIGMDDCGNETEVSQTIVVEDTTAPVFVSVPENITAECDDVPAAPEVLATDNCSDATVNLDETIIPADCGYEIVRTWTATDACGNSVMASQMVTVVDTTAPVASNEPADVTIECDQAEPTDAPSFEDNCDTELTLTANSGISNVTDCGYEIEKVWTATDDCGNSTSVTQIITVVDTTAPVLMDVPADATVECDAVPAPAAVSATDNCSDATVELVELIDPADCGYTLVRTWTATDLCGNTSEAVQVLTVVDTTAPVASNEPADVTIECDQAEPTAEPSFEDNCDTELTLTANSGISNVTDCGYEIEKVWTATDDCGNSTSVTQIITVVDTTSPVFVEVPADATVECDNVPAAAQVEATDNCSDATVELEEAIVDADCGYTLTRTWTATDLCGNTSEAVQVLTVVDTTAPVILEAPADLTVECNEVPGTVNLDAEDNCDNLVEVSVMETETPADCGYIITRTYTAMDDCGNSTEHVQVITVTDTTAPVLIGVPADVNIECGEAIPASPEVSAEDNCDANPIVFMTEETNDLDCGFEVVRIFRAVDVCGNESVQTQTITVADTTAPVIEDAPADITVDCENVSMAATLLATDNCDDNVEVVLTEVAGEGCPYTITRTWTATDDCGNSTSVTQLVTVIDEEAPVWDAFEPFVTVECSDFDGYTLTATDNCDADVTVTIIQDFTVSGGCIPNHIITFQAEDECGNTITAEQIVQVVDTTDPEIFNVPVDLTIACDDEVPAAATDIFGTDNCDDDVEIEFTEVQTNDFCPYEIIRTWTAIDECGNATEGVQTITVTVDGTQQVNLFSFPNPFNDKFHVEFQVPRGAEVVACVLDMTGRNVLDIHKGQVDAQRLYQFDFAGLDWPAGSYIIMLQVDDEVYHHKLIVTQHN